MRTDYFIKRAGDKMVLHTPQGRTAMSADVTDHVGIEELRRVREAMNGGKRGMPTNEARTMTMMGTKVAA